MSKKVEEANKLAENTYKNVMEQFNPGLRNLVNLGKSYEKSVNAMSMAGKLYFDALSKIGENATGSPASKELGAVLVEISEMHRMAHLEMEENVFAKLTATFCGRKLPHESAESVTTRSNWLQAGECERRNRGGCRCFNTHTFPTVLPVSFLLHPVPLPLPLLLKPDTGC
ncbi:hypothetical protein ILYODFUR_002478 [Ilyodon furcidens]|uniref:IMD domain-containing protein n=1 Tax=Ilyodon furcidens TaxID=33524 RepID=A0ABV0UCR1_9TELE